MKKYSLIIKPAIPVIERHEIEDCLKAIGYHINGGGMHADGSICDISFEKRRIKK